MDLRYWRYCLSNIWRASPSQRETAETSWFGTEAARGINQLEYFNGNILGLVQESEKHLGALTLGKLTFPWHLAQGTSTRFLWRRMKLQWLYGRQGRRRVIIVKSILSFHQNKSVLFRVKYFTTTLCFKGKGFSLSLAAFHLPVSSKGGKQT